MLTDEEASRLRAHLQKIAPDGLICPICARAEWNAVDVVTPLKTRSDSAVLNIATAYPLVMLICTNCSNAQFLAWKGISKEPSGG